MILSTSIYFSPAQTSCHSVRPTHKLNAVIQHLNYTNSMKYSMHDVFQHTFCIKYNIAHHIKHIIVVVLYLSSLICNTVANT